MEENKNDYLARLVENIKNNRLSNWEPKWYESWEAYKNNHFVNFNRETGRLSFYKPDEDKFFIQIPKLTKQIRSMINLIQSLKLVPFVLPENAEKEALENARVLNHIFNSLIEWWDFKAFMATPLTDATIFPVVGVEPVFDGKELITFRYYDGFDLYIYPMTTHDPKKVQIIVKSIPKPLEDIKNDKTYNENKNKVVADDRYAKSDMKNSMFRNSFSGDDARSSSDGTAIIDEIQIKERQEDGSVKVRFVTMWHELELKNELSEKTEHTVSLLTLQAGPLYQPTIIEYLIHPNRAYDMLFARVFGWFKKLVKGGWKVRAGTNFKRTNDKNGEMLIYKGVAPDEIKAGDLPNFMTDLFAMVGNMMDEFGVSPVTSSGKLPKGVRAGNMMKQLKEADVQNLAVPIAMYSRFLSDLFTKSLLLIADHWKAGEKIEDAKPFEKYIPDMKSGQYNEIKLISENYKEIFKSVEENDLTCPAYVSNKMKVKVDIKMEDEISPDAQLDVVLELAKANAIKPQALVKAAQLGSPNDVLIDEGKASIIDSEEFPALPPDVKEMVLEAVMRQNTGATTLMDHPDWKNLSPDVQKDALQQLAPNSGQPVESQAPVAPPQ